MNFEELIKNRRSVRKFQNKEVPIGILEGLIWDSILAPNAGNEQPWKFIIIKQREMINRISSECKKNFLDRIAKNPADYAKKYEKMLNKDAFNIFYQAPAVILILGEASLKNLSVDCALAASYLMMSATSRGLGTCWVNFGTAIRDSEMKVELGIPENHTIVAPIAIGYPEKIPAIPRRKEPQILKMIK